MAADELDVLGAAHERQRDEVDADLLAGAQVLEVLLRHGGQRRGLAGDVEPLARGDRAADLDDGVDLARLGARGRHAQAHGAVGEVHDLVRPDGVGEPVPGDEHAVAVAVAPAVAVAAHERQVVARAELDDVVAQLADAQLRTRAGPAGSPPRGPRGWTRRGRGRRPRRGPRRCRGRSSGARRPCPRRPSSRAPRDRARPVRWSRRSWSGAWFAQPMSTYCGSVNVRNSFGLPSRKRTQRAEAERRHLARLGARSASRGSARSCAA